MKSNILFSLNCCRSVGRVYSDSYLLSAGNKRDVPDTPDVHTVRVCTDGPDASTPTISRIRSVYLPRSKRREAGVFGTNGEVVCPTHLFLRRGLGFDAKTTCARVNDNGRCGSTQNGSRVDDRLRNRCGLHLGNRNGLRSQLSFNRSNNGRTYAERFQNRYNSIDLRLRKRCGERNIRNKGQTEHKHGKVFHITYLP